MATIKKVLYPPGGINHIINDMSELFIPSIFEANDIVINCSAQPNSVPHLGTITTVMCSFAIARHYHYQFNKDTSVLFDILENSPGFQTNVNGVTYSLSLEDTVSGGVSRYETNLPYYIDLFSRISSLSNVPYKFRTFREYQRIQSVRKFIVEILKNADKVKSLLEPKGDNLHVRILCPICKYAEKKCARSSFENGILYSECFQHGKFSVDLTDPNSYIDFNAQLRDLVKGLYINDEMLKKKKFIIMCDGGDWAGVWALRVHCEAMNALGYQYHTPRIFCPVITDWSGAKFSKSLYVDAGAYDSLPIGVMDYKSFMSSYGESGLIALWNEVTQWVDSPAMFFRNYSIEYILNVLEGR